jgi:hypothetical protein
MNADGSAQAPLVPGLAHSYDPSWDSLPINGYPRPKAATPMYIPLVHDYEPCTAPNRRHAPPLSHDSCSPPVASSSRLTTGVPPLQPANATGLVKLRVIINDPATPADETDVAIDVRVTDVLEHDATDYTGELRVNSLVRATDKMNSPSPTPSGLGAGTVTDTGFGPSVPCAANNPSVSGSNCSLSTTVNALIPGLLKDTGRTIWQLGRMRVFDGGPDGDGDTLGDNTPFMTQGLFVP